MNITPHQARALLSPHVGNKLTRPRTVAIDLRYPGVRAIDVDLREVSDLGVVTYRSGLNLREFIRWDELSEIVVREADGLSGVSYSVVAGRMAA